MAMRIGVLGSADSWYLRDLARAAEGRHEVVPVAWRDLESRIVGHSIRVRSGGVELNDFDAVLVRTMPAGSLEQVIFRMDALAQLEAAGVTVVNSPKAVETAIDKFLTLARLARAGLPVPATVVCQRADSAIAAFHELGRDVVVKPLFGSEGQGLVRITDDGFAERVLQLLAQQGATLYVQKFIAHPGHDLRLLLIGRRALAMRRTNPDDWRTNISRGAQAEPIEVEDRLIELARRAVEAVGASVAGVDLLPDADGNWQIVEVNAVPGWRGLARALQVDVARLVLEHVGALRRSEDSDRAQSDS